MIEQSSTLQPREDKKKDYWLSLPFWWIAISIAYVVVPDLVVAIPYGSIRIGAEQVFHTSRTILGLFTPIGFQFLLRPDVFIFLFITLIAIFFSEYLMRKLKTPLWLKIILNLAILFLLTFLVDNYATGCWVSFPGLCPGTSQWL